jgi:hypothetical protein
LYEKPRGKDIFAHLGFYSPSYLCRFFDHQNQLGALFKQGTLQPGKRQYQAGRGRTIRNPAYHG